MSTTHPTASPRRGILARLGTLAAATVLVPVLTASAAPVGVASPVALSAAESAAGPRRPAELVMPELSGDTVPEARLTVAGVGLRLCPVQSVPADNPDEVGRVLGQSPPPASCPHRHPGHGAHRRTRARCPPERLRWVVGCLAPQPAQTPRMGVTR